VGITKGKMSLSARGKIRWKEREDSAGLKRSYWIQNKLFKEVRAPEIRVNRDRREKK